MGRNSSDDSESPVRARGSTRKRSPSRREKSPGRHKSSYKESSPVREKPSSRTRSSPRHVKSRSPVKPLVREKPSSRTKSPRRAKSPSPVSRSPVREKHLSRTRSPGRAKPRSPVARSPVREKPSRQTRSPRHAKSSHSPIGEKPLGRTRSPRRVRSRSPVQLPSEERISNHARSPKRPRSISPSRSPSPRTKRLLRARAGSEAEKVSDKEQKRNHKGSDRSTHREKYSEREEPSARREKNSGKDAIDNGSSRSKRGRSTSPSEHHHISRHRSQSPHNAYDRRARDEVNNSRGGERGNGTDDSVAKMAAAAEALEKKEKQKPSFELSGKLAEETNRVRGITLLFNEAPDARKPDIRWRLYVLKGGDVLNEPLYVHRQTCYLFGRERRVADIPTDHPSCSKQHAVLQYRQVEKEKDDGTLLKLVRPYLMDLGSTNGTFINDDRIEPQRYYELVEKDTIKFGNSSREYVLLHENSAG